MKDKMADWQLELVNLEVANIKNTIQQRTCMQVSSSEK